MEGDGIVTVPELRERVVNLLQRFHEPDLRSSWLYYQAVLWECEPSEVLSLLVAGREVPSQPFALVPVLPAGQTRADHVDVLNSTLLTSRPVWLLPSNARPTRYATWVDRVETLSGLLEELGEPIPSIGTIQGDPNEWGARATSTLLLTAVGRMTGERNATAIACALVWRVIGYEVDANTLPVPRGVRDPIDGWHRMLDILTSAQSAAATVLTVLAVEGGGREVRSLSLTKEG